MIPFLLNTFKEREQFVKVFEHYFYKHINKLEYKLYIVIDGEINTDSNLVVYNDLLRTSNDNHLCHSRYERHVKTLNSFKSDGYDYVINCLDDSWIQNIVWEKFEKSIDFLILNNADRIDLCGPQYQYEVEIIDSDVSLIKPTNEISWYFSNQCALWKIDSLLKIYNQMGVVSDIDVEKIGSNIAFQYNYKFITFNNPAIYSWNVFNRYTGLNDDGKKLLKEYSENNDLIYLNELNNINKNIKC
jgi:hypothetical protein